MTMNRKEEIAFLIFCDEMIKAYRADKNMNEICRAICYVYDRNRAGQLIFGNIRTMIADITEIRVPRLDEVSWFDFDKKELKEIAFIWVEHQYLASKRLILSNSLRRDICNMAKRIGITNSEALDFMRIMIMRRTYQVLAG